MASENVKIVEKRNPVNTILLILFILALLLNGWWAYQWFFASGPNSHKTLNERNEQLDTLLAQSQRSADSLSNQLNLTLDQYKYVMEEAVLLRDERDQLENVISEQKVEIRRLINKSALGDPRALLRAKAEIERLKKELVHYQVKLDQSQKENEQYAEVIEDAKSKASQAEEEKNKIKSKFDDIKEKAKSVKFQAANFKIIPTRIKRSKELASSKASKIDHIKISFDLEGNELIEPGKRTISIRILGVNSEVLGADNEVISDSDQLVSWQEEIDYDGSSYPIKFKFKQEEKYQKGDHIVEILDNGKFLTRSSFKLD